MKFGLIGNPLSHSFSKSYFNKRFQEEKRDGFTYDNFELPTIEAVVPILRNDVFGLNVTIPYKTSIIPYLNQIDPVAFEIQAVNTLVKTNQYSWKGYNTDVAGFRESLLAWIADEPMPARALLLGTGGASKAVQYVLQSLGIAFSIVSTKEGAGFTYSSLSESDVRSHPLVINTTPVGMGALIDTLPEIAYSGLTREHWLYDLIYNPANTLFLARGQQAGARTKNGLDMLQLQADHAWAIWKMYGKF
jgi:shikimate dehydrogenase